VAALLVAGALFAPVLPLAPGAHAPGALAAQAQETVEEAPDSVINIAPLQVRVLRTPTAGARTPYAVAGIGAAELRRPAGDGFLAQRLVALPGLQVQNRYNFAVGERFMVRGFGARSQFGVRGLRIFLDGVPATLPDGQSTLDHVDASALGSVELLRGPAAALYGNGAGGVILMESAAPAPGRRLLVDGGGGSFGLLRLSGVAEEGGPESSSRIQVTRLSYDGFRANPVEGGRYGAAERWTVTGRHERPLLGGTFRAVVSALELESENPGSLPADSIGDVDRSAWGFNVRRGTGKEIRQLQAGLRWSGGSFADGGGEGTGVSTTLWGIRRELENPIPTSVIVLDRNAVGGRIMAGGGQGKLRWDVGAEVEAQRDARENYGNTDGERDGLTLQQDESVTGLGTWAALRLESDAGGLHAALRYDRVQFEAEDRFVAQDGVDDSGSRTMAALSPSLGGRLETPVATVFGSFSSFLQTPTTTELANRPTGAGGFNPELDPSTGWTLEGGVRGTVSNRLGWEVVGFYTRLNDELVSFEVPTDPGRSFFRNVGESYYQGMETALRMALPGGTTARLAWTLVDARFDSGAQAGNRLPGRTPNVVEGLIAGASGRMDWQATVRWNDDTPVDDANSAEAPSWWTVDLRAGIPGLQVGSAVVEPWLSVENVLDENYISSVAVNAFGGRFFEPGPGRTFSLGLRAALGR
jgi:iron complex outermembrane receptor protein